MEVAGDKEQQLEQRVAHHHERLQSIEKALNAKACGDQLARLQTSLDALVAEQARGRNQQESTSDGLQVSCRSRRHRFPSRFCFVLALSISTAAEKLSATDISVQEQLVEELTLAMGDLKSRVGPKTLDELVCSIYELLYYHLVIIMVQA